MSSQIVVSVIIIGNIIPYRTISKKHMEIFNEIILMFVMYTIICFTPLVSDIEVRFMIGYICMLSIATHLIVNLIIIGRNSYAKIKFTVRLKLVRKNYLK